MKILLNGNIELTVQLLPDSYAALMAIVERDKVSKATAINIALMTLGHVSEAMTKAGTPLREATDD